MLQFSSWNESFSSLGSSSSMAPVIHFSNVNFAPYLRAPESTPGFASNIGALKNEILRILSTVTKVHGTGAIKAVSIGCGAVESSIDSGPVDPDDAATWRSDSVAFYGRTTVENGGQAMLTVALKCFVAGHIPMDSALTLYGMDHQWLALRYASALREELAHVSAMKEEPLTLVRAAGKKPDHHAYVLSVRVHYESKPQQPAFESKKTNGKQQQGHRLGTSEAASFPSPASQTPQRSTPAVANPPITSSSGTPKDRKAARENQISTTPGDRSQPPSSQQPTASATSSSESGKRQDAQRGRQGRKSETVAAASPASTATSQAQEEKKNPKGSISSPANSVSVATSSSSKPIQQQPPSANKPNDTMTTTKRPSEPATSSSTTPKQSPKSESALMAPKADVNRSASKTLTSNGKPNKPEAPSLSEDNSKTTSASGARKELKQQSSAPSAPQQTASLTEGKQPSKAEDSTPQKATAGESKESNEQASKSDTPISTPRNRNQGRRRSAGTARSGPTVAAQGNDTTPKTSAEPSPPT